MGLLDLFSDKNEKAARNAQIAGLNSGRTAAFNQLNRGEADLRQGYDTADSYFVPYADRSETAARTYSDALGLNGPEGNANAVGAFQEAPGYQYALDEANKAILRTAASRGALAGGGTSLDLTRNTIGMADQGYNSWLDRLLGLNDQGVEIAGARGAISTGLGDRLLGLSQDRAGIDWAAETGAGTARADYEAGKDKTGANIFNAITGGLSLGARLIGAGA